MSLKGGWFAGLTGVFGGSFAQGLGRGFAQGLGRGFTQELGRGGN